MKEILEFIESLLSMEEIPKFLFTGAEWENYPYPVIIHEKRIPDAIWKTEFKVEQKFFIKGDIQLILTKKSLLYVRPSEIEEC